MIRPSHSQISHTHTHTHTHSSCYTHARTHAAAVPRNMGEETLGGKDPLCFSTCWPPALAPISSVAFSAFPPVAILPWKAIPLATANSFPLCWNTLSAAYYHARCIFQLIKKQKDTTSQIPADSQTHFSAPSHMKSLKGLKVSSSSFFPPVLSLASSNQTSGLTSPFKLALLRLQKTQVTFWSSHPSPQRPSIKLTTPLFNYEIISFM